MVAIGGAGMVGSRIVDRPTRQNLGEIVVYDNFTTRS